ncbi:MAG: response regulator transcription factor [Bacteroidota bacterium]|jgi:DNA-binding NarL/FixJ family response regulator
MKISILIFSASEIIRRGLISILESEVRFKIVGEYSSKEEISEQLLIKRPDLLILETDSLNISASEISTLKKSYSGTKFLSISGYLKKAEFDLFLQSGISSCLLTECESEEIFEAIFKTHSGERFLCGKIADILISNDEAEGRQVSCSGFGITERESEIIHLIALGFSNKQIADKLFLSTHTVNTHRKNILFKLGVNNTAGVVMFAVKNNLLEPNQFLFSN